jgi:hypothetical protein
MIPSTLTPNQQPRGYVLLLTVIFLSVIAATIVGSLLLLGLAHSQTGLALQQADQARYFSQACAETALDNLRQNSSYAGDQTLAVGGGSCQIAPITFSSPDYNIQTQAAVGPAVYNLLVEAQLQTTSTSSTTLVQVDSWHQQ